MKEQEDETYRQEYVLGDTGWLSISDTLSLSHVAKLERYVQRAKRCINNNAYYKELFKTAEAEKFEFMKGYYHDLKKVPSILHLMLSSILMPSLTKRLNKEKKYVYKK